MNQEIVDKLIAEEYITRFEYVQHRVKIQEGDTASYISLVQLTLERMTSCIDGVHEFGSSSTLYFVNPQHDSMMSVLVLTMAHGDIAEDVESCSTHADYFKYLNRAKSHEQVPTYTLTFTPSLYGRDSGASYSDPENDIRISRRCDMSYRLYGEGSEIIQQSFTYGPSAFWAVAEANKIYTNFNEMGTTPYFTDEQVENYVGFELMGHVFKIDHGGPERLFGTCISGTYYDYDENNTSYSVSTDPYYRMVTYHRRDRAYVVGKGLYCNGVRVIEDLPKWLHHTFFPIANVGTFGEAACDQMYLEYNVVAPAILNMIDHKCGTAGREVIFNTRDGMDSGSMCRLQVPTVAYKLVLDDNSVHMCDVGIVSGSSPANAIRAYMVDNGIRITDLRAIMIGRLRYDAKLGTRYTQSDAEYQALSNLVRASELAK